MAKVTSSFLTGGGGISFENCVQAMAIVDLACGSVMRVFETCPVQFVALQTERYGYHTDDMLIRGIDSYDNQDRRVLCQIKHGISFTGGDREWTKCLEDFWMDYKNPRFFDPTRDAFEVSLARLQGANVHLNHALGKIRVGNSLELNKKEEEKISVARNIINKLTEGAVSDEVFYEFLKHIYIVEYGELDAWHSVSNDPRFRQNPDLWREAIDLTRTGNSKGARFSINTLPYRLINASCTRQGEDALLILRKHSKRLMDMVKNTVGKCHVERSEKQRELGDALESKRIVFVEGNSGTGKSALVKDYLTTSDNVSVIWLRAEDLNHSSLEECLCSLGIHTPLYSVEARLSYEENLTIVVDSLERLLRSADITCLLSIMQTIDKLGHRFIGVTRGSARGLLLYRIYGTNLTDVSYSCLSVEPFTTTEIVGLVKEEPILKELVSRNQESISLYDPYTLSIVRQAIDTGLDVGEAHSELGLRKLLWTHKVMRPYENDVRTAQERGHIFERICVRRAQALSHVVGCDDFDTSIVNALYTDGLIEEIGDNAYAIAHDKLEDFGVLRHFDMIYESPDPQCDDATLLAEIEDKPSLRHTFTAWLREHLDSDPEFIQYVRRLVLDVSTSSHTRRCCIAAIIEAEALSSFLLSLDDLFDKENEWLFVEAVNTVRLHAVTPISILGSAQVFLKYSKLPIGFIPVGGAWTSLFEFANANIEQMSHQCRKTCIEALEDWTALFSNSAHQIQDLRAAGLLSLALIKDTASHESSGLGKTTLATVATNCYAGIRDEYRSAILHASKNSKHGNWAARLCEDAVLGMGSFSLAKDDPELLAELVKCVFYSQPEDEHMSFFYMEHERNYGLSPIVQDLSHAHGNRPPFLPLFQQKPKLALSLTLEICNHIGKALLGDADQPSINRPAVVTLCDPKDIPRHIVFSPDMWCAYRGTGSMPSIIQSMLMTLENHLIDLAKSDDPQKRAELDSAIEYILKNDETILTIAIVASLATGYPDIIGARCLPLLAVPEFYFADIQRLSQEEMHYAPLAFDFNEVYLYEIERKPSNELPWRTKSLRELCISLQYATALKDAVFEAIDSFDVKSPAIKQLKAQIDTRGFIIGNDVDAVFSLASSPAVTKEKCANQHTLFADACALSNWSKSLLEGEHLHAVESVDEMYKIARMLTTYEEDHYLRAVNLFCVAIVRLENEQVSAAILNWCQNGILDSCSALFKQKHEDLSVQAELCYTDECIKALPLLTKNKCSNQTQKESRLLLKKCFLSSSYSIARPAAEGISLHLWTIDRDYAEELFRLRRENSDSIGSDVRAAGIRWGSDDRTLLMATFPHDRTIKTDTQFIEFVLDAIAADKYRRNNDSRSRLAPKDIYNRIEKGGPATITAQWLYNTKDIYGLKDALLKGVSDAPQFISSIFVYLSAICDRHDDMRFRWEVVKTIQPELIRISLKNPDDSRSEWADLLGTILYKDAPWQPADFNSQNIRFEKPCITSIAKAASNNVVVFESLARLMYHFPSVFTIECIHTLASVGESRLRDIFSSSTDSMFCTVSCLRGFIFEMKENKLTREQYSDCLLLLEVAVDHGSREAYFVRESFALRRWEFKRY